MGKKKNLPVYTLKSLGKKRVRQEEVILSTSLRANFPTAFLKFLLWSFHLLEFLFF